MLLNIVEKAQNSRVIFSDHFQYNGKTMEMHMTKIMALNNTMEKVWNPCFSFKEHQFHASSMGSGLVGELSQLRQYQPGARCTLLC